MKAHTAGRCCAFSAFVLVLLALVHVAAIIGGRKWVAFIGAPDSVVKRVRAGSPARI